MTAPSGCWTVRPESGRTRLDQFLSCRIPGESRSRIQHWIRSGAVRVNGNLVKTGYLLRPGDRIDLKPEDSPVPESPLPEDIPVGLLYFDDDLAVVDKPAGMVCHLGAGVRSGTLVNALLHRFGPIDAGDPSRPGIVHRLDKPTSGLLVVARNPEAHRALALQFKERRVAKEYIALAYGVPQRIRGTIDMPLGRDPVDRKKISIRARRARGAVTHYEVVESLGRVSLLRIRIETGRTHQIRAHLAGIGHPVVGDETYGGNRIRTLPRNLQIVLSGLGRLFLHARRLEFQHPGTGETMTFESPLPDPLAQLLDQLRKQIG